MANIRDVAKHAGVSVATVSRYINRKGYVSKEAKEVIEQSIAVLKYKPNLVARSLSKKQAKFIGLIVPDIMNPFFPELARAVEDVSLTYGYTVVLCNSDRNTEKEIHYIETLKQKYVAGFIVTTNHLDAQHYTNLELPVVALDRTIHASIPTVSSNNKEGSYLGTTHLIEQGCRHILCLRGPKGVGPADDRLAGFLEAVEGKEIQVHVIDCPFEYNQAEQISKQTLLTYPSIDGIFASSDLSAAGALKAAHSLGIDVPGELQIVGFDGISLGEMMTPGLTTVAQDIYKMGAIATRVLIKLIENLPIEHKEIQVPVTLVQRGTTRSVEK